MLLESLWVSRGGKTSRRTWFVAGTLKIVFTLAAQGAWAKSAAPLCSSLLTTSTQSENVRKFVVPDAYEQWLLWEELANKSNLRKPTVAIPLEVVRVGRDEVELWTANPTGVEIQNRFVDRGWVLWPKHPYNTDKSVPFFDRAGRAPPLPIRMTASRSTAPVDQHDITVKAPTDHPHLPDWEYEPKKANVAEDIRDAMLRSRHLQEVDRRLGEDDVMINMLDVFAIIEKKTRTGILVRDTSRLNDGNYHSPALSIPYVGREIAALNGEDFTAFWAKHYASVLGRAKARLLLRYGLQMLTPNAQNYLIPLNRNLEPIGQIEARDLPDSYFVGPVARALGFTKAVARDYEAGLPIQAEILPNWENSQVLFDEAGDKSIAPATLTAWKHAHDMAYIEEIERTLGVVIIKNKQRRSAFREFWLPWTPLAKVQEFLVSPEGLRKLAEFAQAHRLP